MTVVSVFVCRSVWTKPAVTTVVVDFAAVVDRDRCVQKVNVFVCPIARVNNVDRMDVAVSAAVAAQEKRVLPVVNVPVYPSVKVRRVARMDVVVNAARVSRGNGVA